MPVVDKQTALKRRRVAKPQEERLDDLLGAAAAIFAEQGVTGAKVEDITEKAGVSKGTFYLYFTSKEHAADMLWQRYIDRYLKIGEDILARDHGSHLDRLVAVFEGLTEYVLANARLHRTVFYATHSEERRAMTQKFISAIAIAVRKGIEAGELQADEPELMVEVLYHGIGTSLHDAIASGQPLRAGARTRTAGELARLTFSRTPVPRATTSPKSASSPAAKKVRSST
jgi:AcrR family transcriptional regulator